MHLNCFQYSQLNYDFSENLKENQSDPSITDSLREYTHAKASFKSY